MKITVIYKNGNKIIQPINYLYFEDNAIYYTLDKKIHGAFQKPVKILLENVDNFDVEN